MLVLNFGYIRYTAGLLIVLVLCLLSTSETSQIANGWVYDQLLSHVAARGDRQVLLIEANDSYREVGDEVWQPLLQSLRRAGAAQIVFTAMPERASSAFYRESAKDGVIFGRHPLDEVNTSRFKRLADLPQSAVGLPLLTGVAEIAPTEYGMARRQATHFELDDASMPSLETVAAKRAGRSSGPREYLIDFNAGPLPGISMERALKGDLVPAAVHGRTVVVSIGTSGNYRTPLSKTPVSAAQLHAYALDTLLRDSAVRELPMALRFALMPLFVIMAMVVSQRTRPGFLDLATPLCVLLLAALAYALLNWGVWLPIVEPALAFAMVSFTVSRAQQTRRHNALTQLLSEATIRLQKLSPASERAGLTETWRSVGGIVAQSLDLKRAIFMRRISGGTRLQEVMALHCSRDDIAERRRDCMRAPYRAALDVNHAIPVHNYFSNAATEEQQFMVPLSFGGRVEGMWAFSTSGAMAKTPDFHQTVELLSQEIAKSLYFKRQQQRESRKARKSWLSYLRLEGSNEVYGDLRKAMVLFDQRLDTLNQVLDDLQTAAIAFNEFGLPVMVNAPMRHITDNLPVNRDKLNALNFLTALTGIQQDEAQDVLRRILVHREQVRLTTTQARHPYQLTLSPFSAGNPTGGKLSGMRGLVCEVHDVSHASSGSETLELMRKRMHLRLQNCTAVLEAAGHQLTHEALSGPQLRRVVDIARGQTNDALEIIAKAEQIAHGGPESADVVLQPVDLGFAVRQASRELAAACKAHNIKLELNLENKDCLAMADPWDLCRVVKAVLDLLLMDCIDDGLISVQLQKRGETVCCRFDNTGFGMPGHLFLEYLAGAQKGSSQEFARVQAARHLVRRWDATLDGQSDVGQGICFELTMQAA